jgi:hypothetical protein
LTAFAELATLERPMAFSSEHRFVAELPRMATFPVRLGLFFV